jgi:hypothetical protein
MRISIRLVVSALLAALVGVIAFHLVPEPLPELSREEFLAEVRDGHIQKVVIEDTEVILGVSSVRGAFRSPYRREQDSRLANMLRAQGVETVFTKSAPGLI